MTAQTPVSNSCVQYYRGGGSSHTLKTLRAAIAPRAQRWLIDIIHGFHVGACRQLFWMNATRNCSYRSLKKLVCEGTKKTRPAANIISHPSVRKLTFLSWCSIVEHSEPHAYHSKITGDMSAQMRYHIF